MKKEQLVFSISGAEGERIFRHVASLPAFTDSLPVRTRVDVSTPAVTTDWLDTCLHKTQTELFVSWDDEEWTKWMTYHPRTRTVAAQIPSVPFRPEAELRFLSELPFELACFESPHISDWIQHDYELYGFADQHVVHGWACAFKGAGHDRLVSRRWLDFGPWRVLRGPHDTTLVQFHELGIDSETAFVQAHPGHKRMGISRTGGFLQSEFVYSQEYEGYYNRERRVLKILVTGADTLTQGQMLDACAIRAFRADELAPPLKNVAFVFIEPEAAYANLHELWLRELECWTFVNGKETRIDLDYHPTPEKPAWVRRLEAAGEEKP